MPLAAGCSPQAWISTSDGNTDFVFFGESDTPSGKLSALKGGVVRLYIDDDSPANWDFTTPFLNLAKQPITAKIEAAKCFDKWYLFLGSGRYFTTADNYPIQQDFIMAVPFTCSDLMTPAPARATSTMCTGKKTRSVLKLSGTIGVRSTIDPWTWAIDLVEADTNYYKERLITDPTVSSQNMVFFTTTQPYALGRICDSGGTYADLGSELRHRGSTYGHFLSRSSYNGHQRDHLFADFYGNHQQGRGNRRFYRRGRQGFRVA